MAADLPPEVHPQPSIRWRKLLAKGTIWLSAEVVLGLMGMDNLADYSEFLMQSRALSSMGEAVAQLITLIH